MGTPKDMTDVSDLAAETLSKKLSGKDRIVKAKRTYLSQLRSTHSKARARVNADVSEHTVKDWRRSDSCFRELESRATDELLAFHEETANLHSEDRNQTGVSYQKWYMSVIRPAEYADTGIKARALKDLDILDQVNINDNIWSDSE